MKKLFILSLALLVSAVSLQCFADEKTDETLKKYEERYKAKKKIMKMSKDFTDEKASKEAKKQAKEWKKEGWKVSPGASSLEKQYDESQFYKNQEEDDFATKRYVSGNGMTIGENYDAAKMQALEMARMEIAGALGTELTSIVDNNCANKQLKKQDAASVITSIKETKALVSQRLGQTIVVEDRYRELKKGNIQVAVVVYYSMETAREIAKDEVRKNLEEKGIDLGEDLDKLME